MCLVIRERVFELIFEEVKLSNSLEFLKSLNCCSFFILVSAFSIYLILSSITLSPWRTCFPFLMLLLIVSAENLEAHLFRLYTSR